MIVLDSCDGQITSRDGTILYSHKWKEEGELKSIVYLVHGLGEHIMRYTSIAKKFNSHGIRVIGFDQRGHGKSLALGVEKGLAVKGHVGNINEALNDIEALLQIDKTEPVPKFLMGHSMGGLFVIAYALRSTNDTTCPLNGIIASAPALDVGTPVPKLKIALGRFFAKWFPKMTLDNGLSLENISRDPAEVKAFQDDPLCHAKISLQTAASIIDDSIPIRQGKVNKVTFPILVTHGSADVMTNPEASKVFVENLICPDKTFCSYPDAYHNLHLDTIKDRVINDYIEWIESKYP